MDASTETFLEDVLTTAIESNAVGYWAHLGGERAADAIKRRRAPHPRPLAIFEARLVDSDTGREFRVTLASIRRARGLFESPEFRVGAELRGRVLAAYATRDGGLIDGEAADCIIQAATLGEIVYG